MSDTGQLSVRLGPAHAAIPKSPHTSTRSAKTPHRLLKAWRLQDAEAHFSQLVREAQQQGPQRVTLHGKDAAVILSAQDYVRFAPAAAPPNPTRRVTISSTTKRDARETTRPAHAPADSHATRIVSSTAKRDGHETPPASQRSARRPGHTLRAVPRENVPTRSPSPGAPRARRFSPLPSPNLRSGRGLLRR